MEHVKLTCGLARGCHTNVMSPKTFMAH